MERHGHLVLDPLIRHHLLTISPATIDRFLRPIRAAAGQRRKRKRTTKSSREIPIRTFADWYDPGPGFLEVDFVSHGGDSMQGTFLWSLVATDVCSGWTEGVPLVAREQSLVLEGLGGDARQFPVPIRGIDTDNDVPLSTRHSRIIARNNRCTDESQAPSAVMTATGQARLGAQWGTVARSLLNARSPAPALGIQITTGFPQSDESIS